MLCMVSAFITVSSSVGDGSIFVSSCVYILSTGWCTRSSVSAYSVGWDLVMENGRGGNGVLLASKNQIFHRTQRCIKIDGTLSSQISL